MTHTVSVSNDGSNYNVMVDGRTVLALPYTSWWNPRGFSATVQSALAGAIVQNLINVINAPSKEARHVIRVSQNGVEKTFDVLINGAMVASFGYSGLWIVGGLIASQRYARALAFQLANNLSAALDAVNLS